MKHRNLTRVWTGLAVSLCSVLLVLAPARAATEFEDDVPIEIVRHLLGVVPGMDGARLYRDIMESFPAFTVPEGAEVLASYEQPVMRRVLLRTGEDPDAALTALIEDFQARDWMVTTAPDNSAEQRGFVVPQPELTMESLCHSEEGILQIGLNDRILNLTQPTLAMSMGQAINCERQGSSPMAARYNSGMLQYMPRLEIPGQPTIPGMYVGGGGMSSSGQEAEARGNMQDDRPLDEIYGLFSTQLEAQGWTVDGESLGNSVATGTWLKSEEEQEQELVGTLIITRVDDERYDLRFRVIRQGGNRGEGGPRFRSDNVDP